MDYFTSSKTKRRSKKRSKQIKKLLQQEYRNHIDAKRRSIRRSRMSDPFVNNPWDNAIDATRMPVNAIDATRMPVNIIDATRMPFNIIDATRMPVSDVAAAGNSVFCECNHTASPYASTLRVDQPWIREAQQQLRNRDESPEWKQYSQNIRDQQDKLQHDRLVQAENEAWEIIEQGQRRPLYFEPSPISDFVREAQKQLKKRDNPR